MNVKFATVDMLLCKEIVYKYLIIANQPTPMEYVINVTQLCSHGHH